MVSFFPTTCAACSFKCKSAAYALNQGSSSQANLSPSQVMHLISLLLRWRSCLSWHQSSPEHFAQCRSSSDWIHILQPLCLVMTWKNKRKLFEPSVMIHWWNKERKKMTVLHYECWPALEQSFARFVFYLKKGLVKINAYIDYVVCTVIMKQKTIFTRSIYHF